MEIILTKDVSKVGRRNQVVHVSEGYAINYLIPKGMAKAATPSALKELEIRKATSETHVKANQEQLQKDIAAINGKTVTLSEKSNEHGNLFAAIHTDKIVAAIYDQLGVSLPQALIDLPEPLKQTGETPLLINVGKITATITIAVVSK